jgi:hypothetical protein
MALRSMIKLSLKIIFGRRAGGLLTTPPASPEETFATISK